MKTARNHHHPRLWDSRQTKLPRGMLALKRAEERCELACSRCVCMRVSVRESQCVRIWMRLGHAGIWLCVSVRACMCVRVLYVSVVCGFKRLPVIRGLRKANETKQNEKKK